MRWPIQLQLLLPMLCVVVLAIVMVSAASAYLGVSQARRQQEASVDRIVRTLTETSFPLTERVLRQVSGLSGAEFVLLDAERRIQHRTLAVTMEDLRPLEQRPVAAESVLSEGIVLRIGSDAYLGRMAPVRSRGSVTPSGWLVVLYLEEQRREAARQAAWPALVAGAVAVSVAVAVTTVLAGRLVRPVKTLGKQAAAIAHGQFCALAVPERNDEIRDLILSINRMAERLSHFEEEVRRNERLRTLGQLGAGMAHQLRNAATGAWMAVQLHQQECEQGRDCESLTVAVRQLRLMESYLHRFLALGRDATAPTQRVSLQAIVDDVLELVRPACVHGKIDLSSRVPADALEVWGDPEALRQLLINLILNGVEAAGRPESVQRKVVVSLNPLGEAQVEIRVADSGPGPAESTRGRLFEPFVTEKPEGTGLGLYVARQTAEAHGGKIAWERRDGMTCFLVHLPRMTAEDRHGAPADR